jgi:hypothetical protein
MKHLLNRCFNLALLIAHLCLAPLTVAEEVSIIPNLLFSSRNFEYSVFNGGVNGTINSLGGGVTSVYQRFYIDLAGEKNLTAHEDSTTNLLSTSNVALDRIDFTTTLGYALNDSISVFGGYKYGKSTITALPPSPFTGGQISLDGKGLFLGAGGRLAINSWGFLSFSAAYAKMATRYKDLIYGTAKGDASGTSLVVQWKASLFQNFYYDLSLIRHDYYYENFDKFQWDISEQILSYRLGVSYRF